MSAYSWRNLAREEDGKGCSSCDSAEWGTRVPIPGVLLTVEDRVERCDECSRFTSDDAAQLAFAHELCKRGFAAYAVSPAEEDVAAQLRISEEIIDEIIREEKEGAL